MRLRAARPLVLLACLAACDARPSPVSRDLGFVAPPEWMQQDCAPDVETTLLGVPASRLWHCRLPRDGARVTVDWWRGTAVAGERRWTHLDSARWEGFQDSLAVTLAARAVSHGCARIQPPEEYPPGFVPRIRVWSLPNERRWIAMEAMYSNWSNLGYVIVRTEPGAVDPCAPPFRRLVIMGQYTQ